MAPGKFDTIFATNAPVYQSLPGPKAVRLIEIDSSSGDDCIICSLRTIHTYEDAPSYDALSYCWGGAANTKRISCNGQDLLVTENLHLALQRLQRKVACRLLWIDAICINQYDVLERNQQVSNMRDIYINAQRVLVWLGPEDEHTAAAISLVGKISLSRAADFLGVESLSDWPESLNEEKNIRAFEKVLVDHPVDGLPDPRDDVWLSLAQFYSRPWFGRVWIIQEICNTHRASVLCGLQEAAWLMVGFTARWFVSSTQGNKVRERLALAAKDTTPPLGPNNASFLILRDLSTIYESPFLRILDLSLQFKATEPKDRVFALLHHSIWRREIGKREPSVARTKIGTPHLKLEVDYRRSLDDINREVAKRSIRLDKSLEALNFAWRIRTPGSKGLSWVAEWHAELLDRRPPLRPCLFSAGAGTSPQILPSSSPDQLVLEGILLDELVPLNPILDLRRWIYDCEPPLGIPEEEHIAHRLEALSTLLVQDVNDGSGEGSARRLGQDGRQRCMRSFCAFLGATVTQETTDECLIALQPNRKCDVCLDSVSRPVTAALQTIYTCLICRQGNFDICEPCHHSGKRCPYPDHSITATVLPALRWSSDGRLATIFDNLAHNETPRYFQRHSNVAFNRRTLFVTRQGRYGLCPLRAQPGDVVVILFGGRTPFVLRTLDDDDDDDRHQLVSDCYLHGAMDGEAVRGGDALGQMPSRFVLE